MNLQTQMTMLQHHSSPAEAFLAASRLLFALLTARTGPAVAAASHRYPEHLPDRLLWCCCSFWPRQRCHLHSFEDCLGDGIASRDPLLHDPLGVHCILRCVKRPVDSTRQQTPDQSMYSDCTDTQSISALCACNVLCWQCHTCTQPAWAAGSATNKPVTEQHGRALAPRLKAVQPALNADSSYPMHETIRVAT